MYNVITDEIKNMIYFYLSVKIMSLFPEFLDHCSTKRVVIPEEFEPTGKPHNGCRFTSIQFYSAAYDFMETERFKRDFKGYFAIYVNKVCPHCGAVKADADGDIIYIKLIKDTPSNRRYYGLDSDDIEYDSELTAEETAEETTEETA